MPLDRWKMCTKLEEPLILQQFLLFKETRAITQQLILQDLTERSFNPFLDKQQLQGEARRPDEQEADKQRAATAGNSGTDRGLFLVGMFVLVLYAIFRSIF